jgi:hypothetical protein
LCGFRGGNAVLLCGAGAGCGRREQAYAAEDV